MELVPKPNKGPMDFLHGIRSDREGSWPKTNEGSYRNGWEIHSVALKTE